MAVQQSQNGPKRPSELMEILRKHMEEERENRRRAFAVSKEQGPVTIGAAGVPGAEFDAIKSSAPETPADEPDLDAETKTICHLGAPATQGFYVDGPPVAI